MTPISGRLKDLQEWHALSKQVEQKIRDFISRWREKSKGAISNDDVARINLEWLDIMALKRLLDKEAKRLGVDVSNN